MAGVAASLSRVYDGAGLSGDLGLQRLAPGEGTLIHSYARLVRAAAAAAASLALLPAGASAAIVDNGPVECPNRTSTTIQDAVTNAQPGETVVICPGLYEETVTIDKALTLKGAGADLVRIQPSAGFTGTVISATGGEPVAIAGVTIAGGQAPITRAVSFTDATGAITNSRLTALSDGSPGGGAGIVSLVSAPQARSLDVVGSLIEGYGPYGVRFETSSGDLTGGVRDSVVRGRGPIGSPTDTQDGVQVVGVGAKPQIAGNLIADNRNGADEINGAGVRLFDGSSDTDVNDNDLQGNGYGVFRGDATGRCDVATPAPAVDATSNWWGNPAGPTITPQPLCPPAAPLLGASSAGDRVNSGVDFAPVAPAPHGTPVAPAPQPDDPPVLTNVSPADGTEAEPGTQVTVSATATDDFDVKRVEFRRGTTVVGTGSSGPSYSTTVDAPTAGQSQAVTIAAFDSAGQTTAASISLRGKLPPAEEQPQQQAPQQQAEDQPPTVSFTGPSEGASIAPTSPPRLTADARDDRGVARVSFLDDGKVICTDDTAPYDCAYAPTGDDVGRDTLIAVAFDGAGQTAVDFRRVTVGRFDPKLTAATTPKRDRRRPYRYTTTGSVVLPSGVTPGQGCAAGGSVAVEFRAGKLRLPQTTTLRPDCSFRTSIAFPSRRSLGRGRLAVSAKFGGNGVLGTAKAPTMKVRAG